MSGRLDWRDWRRCCAAYLLDESVECSAREERYSPHVQLVVLSTGAPVLASLARLDFGRQGRVTGPGSCEAMSGNGGA